MNDNFRKLLSSIFEDHEEHRDTSGLDCETCCSHFTRLVDLVARGATLHELMPTVEAHLACCPTCNEECQALLCIIRAEVNGTLNTQEG